MTGGIMTIHRVDPGRAIAALLVIGLLPLGACTSSQLGASAPDTIALPRGALLTVESQHVMDMRVFLVRPGLRVRLGTLGTLERRTFSLSGVLLGNLGGFWIELVPLGSSDGYTTDWVPAAAGDRVSLRIAHRLPLSSVVVVR